MQVFEASSDIANHRLVSAGMAYVYGNATLSPNYGRKVQCTLITLITAEAKKGITLQRGKGRHCGELSLVRLRGANTIWAIEYHHEGAERSPDPAYRSDQVKDNAYRRTSNALDGVAAFTIRIMTKVSRESLRARHLSRGHRRYHLEEELAIVVEERGLEFVVD